MKRDVPRHGGKTIDTTSKHKAAARRRILITGGAGFVGSNLAESLLRETSTHITVFDNLSRRGTQHNLAWLRALPQADRLNVLSGDVRNAVQVRQAAEGVSEIYHLAAQVAVTTSVHDPQTDFDINATGTFNVLEAARRNGERPMVFYTSTNKVYGSLRSVPVEQSSTRYRAQDDAFAGATEETPLDFHSPYGCSKGAADQYVRDYARIFGLPTVVFRMSCIAGQRQFGNEDQGWVAHFLYSVLAGKPITIYGDGLQVRDVLHVDDLMDAFRAARNHIETAAGQVYNVGGGIDRAISIQELLTEIEVRFGQAPNVQFAQTRPGDQPLYISSTAKLARDTGWQPRRSIADILQSIRDFYRKNGQRIHPRTAALDAQELQVEEMA